MGAAGWSSSVVLAGRVSRGGGLTCGSGWLQAGARRLTGAST